MRRPVFIRKEPDAEDLHWHVYWNGFLYLRFRSFSSCLNVINAKPSRRKIIVRILQQKESK